ncbi:hypothetical protein, partial [Petrachloros mirabilis]
DNVRSRPVRSNGFMVADYIQLQMRGKHVAPDGIGVRIAVGVPAHSDASGRPYLASLPLGSATCSIRNFVKRNFDQCSPS